MVKCIYCFEFVIQQGLQHEKYVLTKYILIFESASYLFVISG